MRECLEIEMKFHCSLVPYWTKRPSSTSSTEESRKENLEKDFLSPLLPSSSPDSWFWHRAGVDVELTIFPVAA